MPGKQRKTGCLSRFSLIGTLLILSVCVFGGNAFLPKLTESFRLQAEIPYQTVTSTPEQFSNKYYYHALEENDQLIYAEILQGLTEHAGEIYLHSNDMEKTNQLLQFVLNDWPEIFWCDGRGKTVLYEKGTETYSVLSPNYSYNAQDAAIKKQELEAAADTLLSNAPINGSHYEKIKYVYDSIIEQTSYHANAADNQNICSVLLNGTSVCAGYARTTQYLLEKLGVFCIYVTGTATRPDTSEAVPHAWNIVLCDGDYYYVDSTWGDPVDAKETAHKPVYDYLCTNDTELFRTHTLKSDVDLPPCTSDTYNYYILNGSYYETYYKEQILQHMKQAIQAKQAESIFKFSNETSYAHAKEEILDTVIKEAAEYLGKQYGLTTVTYSWQAEDALYKLVILWNYE